MCVRARRGQVIVQLFRCATSPCDLSFMPLFPATTQLPLTLSVPHIAGIMAKFNRMCTPTRHGVSVAWGQENVHCGTMPGSDGYGLKSVSFNQAYQDDPSC